MNALWLLITGMGIALTLFGIPLVLCGYCIGDRDRRAVVAGMDAKNRRMHSELRDLRDFLSVVAPEDWDTPA